MRSTSLALMSVFLALPLLVGCPATVVRESKVFKTEVTWFAQAATQQAGLLRHFVQTQCKCDEGRTQFTDPHCQKAAKTLLTAETRAPWHQAMALYNAGLTDERPPQEPPVIPDPATLCPVEGTP